MYPIENVEGLDNIKAEHHSVSVLHVFDEEEDIQTTLGNAS